MNILENELVKKYFGHNCRSEQCPESCMSMAILSAMQEPIKKGDHYLAILKPNVITEYKADAEHDSNITYLHLRLPTRFQLPERKNCCCGESESIHRTDGPCYRIESGPPEGTKPPSTDWCDKKEVYSNCPCEHCKKPDPAKCRCPQQDICPVHPELAMNQKAKGDAVAEKIEWLIHNLPEITKPIWKSLLEDLVALARNEAGR